jgi:predicted RNase H-like HicB family nuclease
MTATRIETRYDKRSGMYLAVAPDLHYCTGLGKTPGEARARLEAAISLWFDPEEGRLGAAGRAGGCS